jgi:hypothetical protein
MKKNILFYTIVSCSFLSGPIFASDNSDDPDKLPEKILPRSSSSGEGVDLSASTSIPVATWGYLDGLTRATWNKTMSPTIEQDKFSDLDLRIVSEWIQDYKLESLPWQEWKGVTFSNITGLRYKPEYYFGEAMIYDIEYGQLIHRKMEAGDKPFTTSYIPKMQDVTPAYFVGELVSQKPSPISVLFLKEVPEKRPVHRTLTSTTYELYTNDPNRYFKIRVVRYGSDTEPLNTQEISILRQNAQGILQIPKVRFK